jgi:hypothetical protein
MRCWHECCQPIVLDSFPNTLVDDGSIKVKMVRVPKKRFGFFTFPDIVRYPEASYFSTASKTRSASQKYARKEWLELIL